MIYENVKRLSDEKGRSIRSVEIQAGLGNGVIRGWKTSSPTVEKLIAVANALGVSLVELVKVEVKTE